ncbi:hypothetical protein NC651_021614 [Populus alba x Populus x berolinensis]|nr:hypothetical protein NC651_021614 [Populus alba x Populus x berolinensis]
MAKRIIIGNHNEEKDISDITNTPGNNTKLVKQEKEMLLKLVEERKYPLVCSFVCKIIELSGNKLRDLRMNYQKLQAQNWNLAQSNSQMLAELNLGREKLKTLQHEIVCKEALLKAKNLGPQGKADMNCQNVVSQEVEKIEVEKIEEEECVPGAANNDIKHCSRSRRRTARSRCKNLHLKWLLNTRRCVRRQSAASRSQEREPAENLFEIEDVRFPVSNSSDNSLKENGLTSSSITKEEICKPSNEAQVSHRSSIGRPSRRAAEKVQSYKEVPLNVKMRRE